MELLNAEFLLLGKKPKQSGAELQAWTLQETYGFKFRHLPWPDYAYLSLKNFSFVAQNMIALFFALRFRLTFLYLLIPCRT